MFATVIWKVLTVQDLVFHVFTRQVYGGKGLQHEHLPPVCLYLIFPSTCPALGRFTVVLALHLDRKIDLSIDTRSETAL